MNKTLFYKPAQWTATIFAVIAFTSSLSASLIAYESFDGISDNLLEDQATTSTIGYAGGETWSTSPSFSNPSFNGVTTGLTYSGLQTSGGSAEGFRTSNFANSIISTSLAPTTPTTNTPDALYFSFLLNADGYTARADDDADDGFEATFSHSGSRKLGVGFGGASGGNESTAKTLYVIGASGTSPTDQVLQSGTNLVLLGISRPGGSGDNTYNLWLNPDVNNPGAAGWSGTQSFGLVVNSGNFGFYGFNMAHELNFPQSVLADEFRVGTDLNSVMLIPEPSSYVLIMLSGLAFLVVIRPRRKV